MASSPRLEELRKRLEREPGSRLFAQFAEELRRAGETGEAIRVSRAGLAQYPAYATARITLGRALLDGGEVNEAAGEFQQVLKTAPDNLIASRYLGECLEKRGEVGAALSHYEKALQFSPGDEWIKGRVAALGAGEATVADARAMGEARAVASEPAGVEAVPSQVVEAAPESARSEDPGAASEGVRLSQGAPEEAAAAGGVAAAEAGASGDESEEEFELDTSASPRKDGPPALTFRPLVESDGGFGVTSAPGWGTDHLRTGPIEVPARIMEWAGPEAAGATAGPATAAPERPASPAEAPLESRGAGTAGEPARPQAGPARESQAPGRVGSGAAEGGTGVGADELASPTLAELYAQQGSPERALRMYEDLVAREPGKAELEKRRRDLAASVRSGQGRAPGAGTGGTAGERAIRRLERFLAATRAAAERNARG